MSNVSLQRDRIEARRRVQKSRSGLIWSLVIIGAVAIFGYLLWVAVRPAGGTPVALEGEDHIPNGSDPQ